ncbi:MAG: hypothetical protein M1334_02490, partial [Patescibacteria group bacterium]|nr:hypothetical protein [Patescibacteria group bacterium]
VVFSIAEPNSGFGCTVTYVHKNHFWLCAHAFMHSENNKTLWLGKINIPVYSANMITTIKGKASSYKIMTEKTPLRYIGAITYDNAYAIDGVLGAPAKLINLYIRIKKPTLKDSEWQKLSVSPTIFAGEDLFDMAVSHLFSYWPNATSTVVLKSAIRISKTSVSMFSADLSSGGEKSPDVWRLIKNISELLDKDGTADWATTMPSATVNVQVFSGNRFLHLVKKELVEDTTIKDAANRHFNLLLELKNADDSKVAKLRIPFYIPKDDKQISLEIYSGDTNLNPLVPKDSPFGALLIMLGANEKPINMKTENGFVSSVKEIADHHKSLDKIYIRVTLNKQAHSQYYKFLEPTSLPPGYFIKNLNENM